MPAKAAPRSRAARCTLLPAVAALAVGVAALLAIGSCHFTAAAAVAEPGSAAAAGQQPFKWLTTAAPPTADDVRDVSGAVSAAGLRTLASLAAADAAAPSIWVSPASISAALLMLAASADEPSAAEVLTAIGVDGARLAEAVAAAAELRRSLMAAASSEPTWAAIANSLWARDDVPPRPEYVAAMQQGFSATVGNVSSASLSGKPINEWASNATRGLIATIVPATLPPSFVLALVNPVYFKGKWEKRFPKQYTQEAAPFYASDGVTRAATAPLMHVDGNFQYAGRASWGSLDEAPPHMQAVRLPYQRCASPCTSAYSAVIVLPPKGTTPEAHLADIVAAGGLRPAVLHRHDFYHQSGSVSLPRFTADFSTSLVPALEEAGVKRVFGIGNGMDEVILGGAPDDRAGLTVTDVVHAVKVEVDEEGTEAAAVTAVHVGITTDSLGPPPFRMVVDRPFLFFIVEDTTDATLFAGIVRRVGAEV